MSCSAREVTGGVYEEPFPVEPPARGDADFSWAVAVWGCARRMCEASPGGNVVFGGKAAEQYNLACEILDAASRASE